jgi:Ca2+-binding RTX toxin-like protein
VGPHAPPVNQHVFGGPGDDHMEGSYFTYFTGGPGNDTMLGKGGWLRFDDSRHPVRVDLAAGTATGDGSDTFRGPYNLTGSAFGDVLLGDHRFNYIVGGAGADRIESRRHLDRIYAGEGNDTIVSGAGRDDVFGGPGSDRIAGGPEGDSVHGGRGDDVLRGDDGDDLLGGGADTDAANGGRGTDTCRHVESERSCELP